MSEQSNPTIEGYRYSPSAYDFQPNEEIGSRRVSDLPDPEEGARMARERIAEALAGRNAERPSTASLVAEVSVVGSHVNDMRVAAMQGEYDLVFREVVAGMQQTQSIDRSPVQAQAFGQSRTEPGTIDYELAA